METNQEKRTKFQEVAGKRVNNIIHDIKILIPMATSINYDYTKEDIDKMFLAIQNALETTKVKFEEKLEKRNKKENDTFSFDNFLKNDESEEI